MSEPIEVVVGQPLKLTLQSMAGSTGYGWYLSKLDGGLILSAVSTQPTAPGIAPVLHIFDFLAIEAGAAQVEFKLMAPWRPGEPAKTETYEVTITEQAPTAAEDIEAAMKGKSFVDASALGANSATILKYSAPNVIYAAPMSQAASSVASIIYSAPMPYPGGILPASATTSLAYAAPMPYPGGILPASAAASLAYAAPMPYPGTAASIIQPYAAPWTNGAIQAGVNAATVMVAYAPPVQYGAYQAGVNSPPMMQPYAAPWTCGGPQLGANAATMMAAYSPAVQYGAYLGANAATVMVAYAPPVQYGAYQAGANAALPCGPSNGCSPVYPLYAAPMTGPCLAPMVGQLNSFAVPICFYAAPVTGQGCC